MSTCPFCGQPQEISLFEVYSDGTFQVETCCHGLHDSLLDLDPDEWKHLLSAMDIEGITGNRLRCVVDDGCGTLLADYHLQIRPVSLAAAKAFVAKYHQHNPAPAGWKFGCSIHNGQQIGVLIAGRPVARMIDQTTTIEVNRLCLRRDIPAPLRWNACSQLYGWACRQARKMGYRKVITYTLADEESGTSLRAAGFAPVARTRGRSWNAPSRPRKDRHNLGDKIRWERIL